MKPALSMGDAFYQVLVDSIGSIGRTNTIISINRAMTEVIKITMEEELCCLAMERSDKFPQGKSSKVTEYTFQYRLPDYPVSKRKSR